MRDLIERRAQDVEFRTFGLMRFFDGLVWEHQPRDRGTVRAPGGSRGTGSSNPVPSSEEPYELQYNTHDNVRTARRLGMVGEVKGPEILRTERDTGKTAPVCSAPT